MDVKSITKRISTVGVALSFVMLTACGGGDSAASTPVSGDVAITNAQINAAQATLDAQAGVSAFDYAAINAGRASCIGTGVINTNAEINCYQAFLETIAPVV
jgi:tetrahydromethanopterin S-methyltransferase subunit A